MYMYSVYQCHPYIFLFSMKSLLLVCVLFYDTFEVYSIVYWLMVLCLFVTA